MPYRTRIVVDVRWNENGDLTPLAVVWSDGTRYKIARAVRSERVREPRTNESGTCYTCHINSTAGTLVRHIYRFGRYWYVYAKHGGD